MSQRSDPRAQRLHERDHPMSRAKVVGTISGVSLAVGAGLAIWSSQTLAAQGAWTSKGAASGHLDFTVAAVLLVGVALLIAGFIIALAAVAEVWSEAQDQRDAQVEARHRRAAAPPTRPAAPSHPAAPSPEPVTHPRLTR